MNDDLISRESVIKAVDRHTREDGTLDEDISVILEEVKTAFNKEKVIEELMSTNCELDECDNYDGCFDHALIIAKEIVEKGGIE